MKRGHHGMYGGFSYKGKAVVRPSYLYNGNPCTDKTTPLYWDRAADCRVVCVTAWFVTRFILWLRYDLWPHNTSICDPARFVTKSASICDPRYTMILESKLCRGKLVFVFTLIMYAKWYNMIIHIYMNYDIVLYILFVERQWLYYIGLLMRTFTGQGVQLYISKYIHSMYTYIWLA